LSDCAGLSVFVFFVHGPASLSDDNSTEARELYRNSNDVAVPEVSPVILGARRFDGDSLCAPQQRPMFVRIILNCHMNRRRTIPANRDSQPIPLTWLDQREAPVCRMHS
jgi:hypothetical protein